MRARRPGGLAERAPGRARRSAHAARRAQVLVPETRASFHAAKEELRVAMPTALARPLVGGRPRAAERAPDAGAAHAAHAGKIPAAAAAPEAAPALLPQASSGTAAGNGHGGRHAAAQVQTDCRLQPAPAPGAPAAPPAPPPPPASTAEEVPSPGELGGTGRGGDCSKLNPPPLAVSGELPRASTTRLAAGPPAPDSGAGRGEGRDARPAALAPAPAPRPALLPRTTVTEVDAPVLHSAAEWAGERREEPAPPAAPAEKPADTASARSSGQAAGGPTGVDRPSTQPSSGPAAPAAAAALTAHERRWLQVHARRDAAQPARRQPGTDAAVHPAVATSGPAPAAAGAVAAGQRQRGPDSGAQQRFAPAACAAAAAGWAQPQPPAAPAQEAASGARGSLLRPRVSDVHATDLM